MRRNRTLVLLMLAVGAALASVSVALARTAPDRPYEGVTNSSFSFRASSGYEESEQLKRDDTGAFWLDFDPRATVVDLRRNCGANPLAIVPVASAPDRPGNTTRLLVRCPTPKDDER